MSRERRIREVTIWGIVPVRTGMRLDWFGGPYRTVVGFWGPVYWLFIRLGWDDAQGSLYRGCYGYFDAVYNKYFKRRKG